MPSYTAMCCIGRYTKLLVSIERTNSSVLFYIMMNLFIRMTHTTNDSQDNDDSPTVEAIRHVIIDKNLLRKLIEKYKVR